MAPKEGFLACSTQFIFLIIKLVPGNVVVIVAIDMCGKIPITREWIYGIAVRENMYYLSYVFRLFIYLFV